MDLFNSDPDRPRRSIDADGDWWERLTADSPLWSLEGSLARDECPVRHLLSGIPRRPGPEGARNGSARAGAGVGGSVEIGSTDAVEDAATVGSAASSAAVGTGADSAGADSAGAGSAGAAGPARAGAADAAGPVGDDSRAASAAGSSGAAGPDGASAAGSGGAGTGSAGAGSAGDAGSVGDAGGGAGRGRGRSSGVRTSWVLVASLRESAQALALAPVPDDAGICLAEAEDLMFVRDRITSALADRVGRVHRAGQARQHGHASTRSWLRTVGGLSVAGAGRLLTLGVQLARLPRVREAFAGGGLSAGVVEAICMATEHLTGEQVGLAEPILLELAGRAGPAEVARAGRYLRAVLDPDGDERDERADYGRQFLRVRPGKGGGLEGEFYLPREAAARLRALLDAYARPRAEGDDRPLRVRQADALIALLEQKIVAELLVLVNAESLPTDPVTDTATDTAPDPATDPAAPDPVHDQGDQDDQPEDAGASDTEDLGSRPDTQDAEDTADADNVLGAEGGRNAEKAGETGSVDDAADADDPSGADDACGVDVVDAAGRGDDLCDRTETTEVAEPGPAVSESAASELIKPVESVGPAEAVEPAPGEAEGTDAVAPGAGAGLGDAAGYAQPEGNEPESKQQEGTQPEGTQSEEARPEKARSSEPQQSKPRQRESQQSESRSGRSRWDEWQPPDPPAWGASARHAHAGPRPAGESRHGLGTPEAHGGVRGGQHSHDPGSHDPGPHESGTWPGQRPVPGPGADPEPGPNSRPEADSGQGPGPDPEPGPGADPGSGLGALLGRAPGLLLATGQVLPVSGVHRLARTSTLVRLVMNADGQVLDMGRKVRLATPAQRRAVFARYATCWIDGCPLPATMCQIDHADNWSTGGLTDLKLLGPACQFHNRDRYQHPERYTRHTTGKDRWAFTYHHPTRAPRRRD
ncbi:DUF222 domain-containing protein [Microbispora sp. CA-135349]|uniref:HNH endonuclease signature motif containing protein n=1 Tax=Microbispora sp. CA-135349 TaxID=3239953 RepID=UPI003D8F7241